MFLRNEIWSIIFIFYLLYPFVPISHKSRLIPNCSKIKIYQKRFFHISLVFLTFQNLNHKNMIHFPTFAQIFIDVNGSKVCQNCNFAKIPSFLLNNSFRKTLISQKPAKTGSWFFLDSCHGLCRITKYYF